MADNYHPAAVKCYANLKAARQAAMEYIDLPEHKKDKDVSFYLTGWFVALDAFVSGLECNTGLGNDDRADETIFDRKPSSN